MKWRRMWWEWMTLYLHGPLPNNPQPQSNQGTKSDKLSSLGIIQNSWPVPLNSYQSHHKQGQSEKLPSQEEPKEIKEKMNLRSG